MDINLFQPVILNNLKSAWLQNFKIELSILRLDLIHPLISGNKWFKLKENVKTAHDQNKNTLLSFGGAYSNHLLATAALAKERNMTSIGYVRGFHGEKELTPSLNECKSLGMDLYFLSREVYKEKNNKTFLESLQHKHPNAYIIPEGGDNELGKKGAGEIVEYIPNYIDVVCAAIGTGTTFCGIREDLDMEKKLLGFPAIKKAGYLENQFKEKYPLSHWEIIHDYHFNGFAKWNAELIQFMNAFYLEYQIPLDFVYTAKMVFGIFDMIKQGSFSENEKILIVHSGGLQGNRGLPNGILNF